MGTASRQRICSIYAVGVLLAGACRDGSSSGESSSAGSESTASADADATGTDGESMCGGSSTTAECSTYCAGVVAAACPAGPTTQAECEQGCEMLNGVVAQCPAWGALVDCAQASPVFACVEGEPVPMMCEVEYYCLSLCFQ